MKAPSSQHITFIMFVALLFSMNGCTDDGNSSNGEQTTLPPIVSGPTGEFTLEPIQPDDPRQIIPCKGDLCYDPTDAQTKERYNTFYNDMAPAPEPGMEDPDEIAKMNDWRKEFYSRLQHVSDSFAACNYTQFHQDVIKVECPTWVYAIYACPGHFFQLFGEDLPAILHVADGDTRVHYCLEAVPNNTGKRLSCNNGHVSSGGLSAQWENADGYRPFCIASELCMQLSEDEGISGEDVCFYGDFTTAQTGEIAPQDCDTLEPGTCAINCPCGSAAEGPDQGCQFLSEDNPVGICGLGSCYHSEDHNSCPLPSLSCAMPKIPAWVQAAVQQGPMEDAPLGVCVAPSTCDIWSQSNDVLDTCGTPAVVLPDTP